LRDFSKEKKWNKNESFILKVCEFLGGDLRMMNILV
jgi:hypothetical protein